MSAGGAGNPTGNPTAASAASSDREQKMLEASTESILQRVGEIKQTIAGLVSKLEGDPRLNWPSFLDSYALVSGQLNSLLKNVKHERTPSLKKYICLPLALAPERDEELVKMTEGRVHHFSHDLVPDYLRTKPDPEVEQKHGQFESRASAIAAETAQKHLNVLEKITRETIKNINKEREDMESRASSRAEVEKTCAIEDTYGLVAAISHGKGLRQAPLPMHPGAGPMGAMGPGGLPGMRPGGPVPPGVGVMGPSDGMPKAPNTIKTNIKAASQVHPYSRVSRP